MSERMIITKQVCPVCDGMGTQYNADWREFLWAWKSLNGGAPAEQIKRQKEFFLSRGYAEIPDTIEQCSCCKGRGVAEGTLPVKDIESLPEETASKLGLSLGCSPNKLGTVFAIHHSPKPDVAKKQVNLDAPLSFVS